MPIELLVVLTQILIVGVLGLIVLEIELDN